MSQINSQSPLDVMLDALNAPCRRRILLAIFEHSPRKTTDFTEGEFAPDDGSETTCKQLKLQLHHVHLPKLVRMGYVDWNRETQTVDRGPNFEDIASLLKLMDAHGEELPTDWP